ncbi:MAG: biotin-dependent carboxyltransferase family protein [Gemmatimonadaceae bacterium]
MTLSIHKISGFATIQDAGRPGYRQDGVPTCGAMDVASLALANSLVGNPAGAAAIEWALAGGSLRFLTDAMVAVTGAEVELARNGAVAHSDVAMEFGSGDELAVGRFIRGAYAYVSVRGGIDVRSILGSRSTYLPAGFGGLDGRRLRAGDVLTAGGEIDAQRASRTDAKPAPPGTGLRPIRVIEGPNTAAFSRKFRESFWASEFTVSPSSNRTGYRLDREPRRDPQGGGATSEPACVGAIQVANGAGAIVLMADGPTVGGYPKIGVVASVDIPALAQRIPGDVVSFERIDAGEAQRILRAARSLAWAGAHA